MANKPAGRPRTDPKMHKKTRCFRVTDAVYEAWQARSKRMGLTLIAVIEPAVERELARLEAESK